MAPLKLKGDRAEIEVARDLIRRGLRIAIPYGEDWDFDLARRKVIPVRCRSSSLTTGATTSLPPSWEPAGTRSAGVSSGR
jgi:hypothetical protein